MSFAAWIVNASIRTFINITCKIDKDELLKVPKEGPLILVSNHITSLEVPLFYSFLMPRKISGFAKAEFWNKPISRLLFNKIWNAIPIHRGTVDLKAFRLAHRAFEEKFFLAVAPEGTRSWNGQLKKAQGGVVMLALHDDVPILPLAHYGGEHFKENLIHFRRTDFHIKVGKPFKLSTKGEKMTNIIRQQMTDEIMYQIAKLLPPEYRGYYADFSRATKKYIHFI
ncbi:MAG: 1-acyl-sn-glycerol-3-phosphate acyltransferase [Spirochaetes bacterium]|nr:MAG: 1-acyl-sn-glycerol-3-phosphate acyltransferase [Spirochaetota bacterium]